MRIIFFLVLSTLVVGSWAQDIKRRIDCYPEPGATNASCLARNCKWAPPSKDDPPGTPSCYQQTDQIGYLALQIPGRGNTYALTKRNQVDSPWGNGIPALTLEVIDLGKGVTNVKIYPAYAPNIRYDPGPLLNFPREVVDGNENLTVVVDTDSSPFSFSVQRSDGRKLFDTSIGGLIFAEQFIQIATLLPSENMYGWGENVHMNLKHDFSQYTAWGMLDSDDAPDTSGAFVKQALYGVHPFYLVIENDGKAHGVFFLNSNAQDVTTIPAPGLVYRTIGGNLDMYFFPGPSPSDVIRQYHAFIGRPFLPAYWALGYQLCRYGYKNLTDMKTRVEAVRKAQIPFDVAYADIDYMKKDEDFTVADNWAGFGDYVKELQKENMRSILIFDHAIGVDYGSFQRARAQGVGFIEWERDNEVPKEIQGMYQYANDTKYMLGTLWPMVHVAFPDFLDPQKKTDAWWTAEFKKFHDEQVPFDGAWIDMNEPSSEGTNEDHPWYFDNPERANLTGLKCPTAGDDSTWDVPPYTTQSVFSKKDTYLASKTLCMRAMTVGRTQRFYDTKNLYGWSESRATQAAVQAVTGKRGAVISRSTFPSSGRYAGHWLGDNSATWLDIRTAVIGVMEFNFFGMPYVGSDVCGFRGESNEELCLRWQQLGAFHSFFRNHNDENQPYQDPAVWPSVAAATKKANEFRYSLLPYLFSLHFGASLRGDTVVRPLFFEFPADNATYSISEQFMWGPQLLVAPVLYKGAQNVTAYLPDAFYSLYYINYGQRVEPGTQTFAAPTTSNTPTFVRLGAIIPRQPANITTAATRQGNLNLLIVPDTFNSARGELYWDDGESILDLSTTAGYSHVSFKYQGGNSSSLVITTDIGNAPSIPKLAYVEIFASTTAADHESFTLNGERLLVHKEISSHDAASNVRTVYFREPIDISEKGKCVIEWGDVVFTNSTTTVATSTPKVTTTTMAATSAPLLLSIVMSFAMMAIH